MTNRALVSTIFGFMISAVCLVYAFYGVDLSAVIDGMHRVDPLWMAASILSALLSLLVRGVRWKVLLVRVTDVPAWSSVSATFIGMMANNVLPARVGEVVKAWILAKREHKPVSTILGTVVIERLCDVIAALMVFGVALAAASNLAESSGRLLTRAGLFLLLGVFGVVGLLLVVLRYRERFLGALHRGAGEHGRVRELVQMGDRFLEGLAVLKGHALILVALLSVLVWVIAIASFYALARGLELDLSVGQSTLAFIIVLFGVAIPSAPGFVGTFHGFCVAGLTIVAQTDPTLAATYATLLHGLQWLAVNIVGVLFLIHDRAAAFSDLKLLATRQA